MRLAQCPVLLVLLELLVLRAGLKGPCPGFLSPLPRIPQPPQHPDQTALGGR
jgi:hypothetical protein